MNRQSIENHMMDDISPLVAFLGEDRADKLKDRVCDLIINRIEQDMNEQDKYMFIWNEDFEEVVDAAKKKCRSKMQKMFEEKYLKIAQRAVDNVKIATQGE